MSLATSGSLTTTGSVALTGKPVTDTSALVQISGTYGTVTLVLEASLDGTNYFAVDAIDASTGNIVTGTLSPSDNATQCWKVPCDGYVAVRARVTAIASGTAAFIINSGAFVAQAALTINNAGNTLSGALTMSDANNIVVGTSTGTKIGTATSQKLGFFNATPIVQPANTVDYVTMLTNLGLRATGGTAAATFPGNVTALSFLASNPTTGVGYATGAGGTATQSTDRTTTVSNMSPAGCLSGTITTQATSLAAGASVQFTVNNTSVAVGDVVVCSVRSGPTTTSTTAQVVTVASQSFKILLVNSHASTADTGAAIINFAVFKAVSA